MTDKNPWVKVCVVSGALFAGCLSYSPANPVHDEFKALVVRYSIKRRQWVEMGIWWYRLAILDGNPAPHAIFLPSEISRFYLDARDMDVCWQGNHQAFARQCEIWIEKTLRRRGITNSNLIGDNKLSDAWPTEDKQEAVNQAFHDWCTRSFQSDLQICEFP